MYEEIVCLNVDRSGSFSEDLLLFTLGYKNEILFFDLSLPHGQDNSLKR